MQELISVIVPIYNVEPYLQSCVDSILAQTYQNLEIILVDDGSPDRCPEICDSYLVKDPRVRVIHKPNGGLSDARNAGLDIATGNYYCFVDSDDILPTHSLMTLHDLLTEYRSDMVIAGFERFRHETGDVFFSTESEGVTIHVYTQEEAVKDFYRDGCQAWAVLYKRLIHEKIRFPKGEINEDEAVIFQILENCSRVVVTNKVVYKYRCREESITTAPFTAKKLDWVKHCRDNLQFIREKHPALEFHAVARYRSSILWALREIALSQKPFATEQRQLTAQLKENARLFSEVPFTNTADRLRYYMMRCLPFGAVRFILRLRHRG